MFYEIYSSFKVKTVNLPLPISSVVRNLSIFEKTFIILKKLLIILLLCITVSSYSQSWRFTSGGDDFDGKYKTSSIVGVGNKFPYKTPSLVINKFSKSDGDINFYISSAGFYQKNTGIRIYWVFNNEPNTIYSTYDYSISSDGKILFLEEFNSPDSDIKITKYEFIEKLKNASTVSVRISNKYAKNDIKFSLRGSTKAINSVLPQKELQLKIEDIQKERKINNVLINKKKILFDSLIKSLENEKLSESSLSVLESKIKDDLGIGLLGGEGTGLNYKKIKIKPTSNKGMFKSYGYVDLFYILNDDSEKSIYGTFKVEMDAPLFKRVESEEKEAKVKQEADELRIKNIISKYKDESLKTLIFTSVLRTSKGSYKKVELSQIQKIGVIISKFQYKKFWDIEIILHLNNDEKLTIKESVYSLNISKKTLKSLGGKADIEF